MSKLFYLLEDTGGESTLVIFDQHSVTIEELEEISVTIEELESISVTVEED